MRKIQHSDIVVAIIYCVCVILCIVILHKMQQRKHLHELQMAAQLEARHQEICSKLDALINKPEWWEREDAR